MRLGLLLTATAMGIAGMSVVWHLAGWRVAFGVFLMLAGNNLQQDIRRGSQ